MAAQTTSRIRRVSSSEVPEPAPGTWSNCLVVNGVAYVAGMIARGKDGKIVDGEIQGRRRISLPLTWSRRRAAAWPTW
jgi:enamine deaminase RidA (YjgF/YER057c/UK114 family)